MSRSLNKVTLIGNVGSDPDIRTTPSGTRVAKLSLATNYRYKDRNDQFQDKTEWHRLTFFGRLGRSGRAVCLEGGPDLRRGATRVLADAG
jgi:single-strand DNA-binding protein